MVGTEDPQTVVEQLRDGGDGGVDLAVSPRLQAARNSRGWASGASRASPVVACSAVVLAYKVWV